jgi:hypothetical protein
LFYKAVIMADIGHPLIYIGFPGWMTREAAALAYVEITGREPGFLTEPEKFTDNRSDFGWMIGRCTFEEAKLWKVWYEENVGDRWRKYVMGRETIQANIEPDDEDNF